jgi:hypothetical protein
MKQALLIFAPDQSDGERKTQATSMVDGDMGPPLGREQTTMGEKRSRRGK